MTIFLSKVIEEKKELVDIADSDNEELTTRFQQSNTLLCHPVITTHTRLSGRSLLAKIDLIEIYLVERTLASLTCFHPVFSSLSFFRTGLPETEKTSLAEKLKLVSKSTTVAPATTNDVDGGGGEAAAEVSADSRPTEVVLGPKTPPNEPEAEHEDEEEEAAESQPKPEPTPVKGIKQKSSNEIMARELFCIFSLRCETILLV